jgi:radical SAM superfamily enzyme YgiQ (UPF0313 family)
MQYEQPLYRPPSEAGSLIIQATLGCPHNRCTFCGMYKGKRFHIRPVDDVVADLRESREECGEQVRTLFFADGNTIVMKTRQLVEILQEAAELFPHLERMTSYGSARFVLKKSPEEWRRIREAGLSRVHMGIETGDAMLLQRLQKGATPDEMITAGRRLKEAGLEVSEYILVGIGGAERTREHAIESARVLNAIDPDFIRLRTWVPVPGAPLAEDWAEGRFDLLDPQGALAETRLLVERLDCNALLLSDHVSNFADCNGRLPDDKEKVLAQLDAALGRPRSAFHPSVIEGL